jgi:hypothetical protein
MDTKMVRTTAMLVYYMTEVYVFIKVSVILRRCQGTVWWNTTSRGLEIWGVGNIVKTSLTTRTLTRMLSDLKLLNNLATSLQIVVPRPPIPKKLLLTTTTPFKT